MSNKLRIRNWTITTKQDSTTGTNYKNQARHTLEVHGAAEVAIKLQSFMHYISGNSKTLEILGNEGKKKIDISTEGLKKFCKMVLELPDGDKQSLWLHDINGNVIRFNISDNAR